MSTANILSLRDTLASSRRGLTPVALAHLHELSLSLRSAALSSMLGVPQPVMSRVVDKPAALASEPEAAAPFATASAAPAPTPLASSVPAAAAARAPKPKSSSSAKKKSSATTATAAAAAAMAAVAAAGGEISLPGSALEVLLAKPRKGRPPRILVEARMLAAAAAAAITGDNSFVMPVRKSAEALASHSSAAASPSNAAAPGIARLPHRFRNTVDSVELIDPTATEQPAATCELCSEGQCEFRIAPAGPALHARCVERCPRVLRRSELKWWNLKHTVGLAARTACSVCHGKKAAVYCIDCDRAYHVQCADAEGFCDSREPRCFLCPEHRAPCTAHGAVGCFDCSPAFAAKARRVVLRFAGETAADRAAQGRDDDGDNNNNSDGGGGGGDARTTTPASVSPGGDPQSGGGRRRKKGRKKERVRVRNLIDVVGAAEDADAMCELCGNPECDVVVRPGGPTVHASCALRCPRVLRINGEKWYNLVLTVDKARDTACARCCDTMAAVACIVCQSTVHVRCAEDEGFCMPAREPRVYLCAEHRQCAHGSAWDICPECAGEFFVKASRAIYKFARAAAPGNVGVHAGAPASAANNGEDDDNDNDDDDDDAAADEGAADEDERAASRKRARVSAASAASASAVAPRGEAHEPRIRRRKREVDEEVYEVGALVDCLDTTNTWVASRVIDSRPGEVLVHYLGWNEKWDEWLPTRSPRIEPAGKHVPRKRPAGSSPSKRSRR